MLSRILIPVSMVLTLLLSGCATPTKMAFADGTDAVAKTNKPVFLLTATIKNTYKQKFQPKLLVVNVERAEVKGSADRINFTMDDKAKHETGSPISGNDYFLRLELEPGEYVIRGLTSMSQSFPITALFFAPLHVKVDSTKPGVYYLGHVEATVRERQEKEFKAGPSIPLIDQAVAGASGGTFDIAISDQWEKDGPKFLSRFPVLNSVAVEKAIMPPFDREKAQQWWEVN